MRLVSLLTIIQATTPPAAAKLVLTKMSATAVASAPDPIASCDPPLNPNHPSQRMKTPKVVIGNEHPGNVFALPSLENFPSLAPRRIAPASDQPLLSELMLSHKIKTHFA